MNLSVVIPAYNALADTYICLNSLQAMATAPHHYHVQDDASPDANFPATISARVATCQRNETNLGFGANVNAGMAAVLDHSDVVLVCNQDISAAYGLSDGWDAKIAAIFDDPQVGIVAPLLLFPDGKVQSCGGEFDAACQPVHSALGWADLTHPRISNPRDVPWATGAALAFRRECWEAIGGFDAKYGRGYFEDVAACLVAREKGWRIRYTPSVRLVHRVGSTGGNPNFGRNALLWKQEWVDTGKVKPGSLIPTVRFW